MKKLVIFDLDGTLLNTIDDLGNAANHALAECGFPTHALSAYPYFVGNGITRLIERVLPEDYRTEAEVNRVRATFITYYNNHLTDFTKPYPGIVELLESLTLRNIHVAVASNKYQEGVEKLITHFFPNIPWSAVEGQKPDLPTKPDPSIVFEILAKAPTPKADVLYIGDSGVDMTTARRACVESVGVSWGFRPIKELRDNYADHIVNSPSEILQIALTNNLTDE